MNGSTLVGIVLIILGVLSFSYDSISYTKKEKVLDVGPLNATLDKRETLPIPAVGGVLLAIGGVILVVLGSKKTY